MTILDCCIQWACNFTGPLAVLFEQCTKNFGCVGSCGDVPPSVKIPVPPASPITYQWAPLVMPFVNLWVVGDEQPPPVSIIG